jgi:hypothetical protein
MYFSTDGKQVCFTLVVRIAKQKCASLLLEISPLLVAIWSEEPPFFFDNLQHWSHKAYSFLLHATREHISFKIFLTRRRMSVQFLI